MSRWSYWIKSGALYSLAIFLMSIMYGIFIELCGDEFSLHGAAHTAYDYGTTMSSIMLVVLIVSRIPFISSLILSLGETRKNLVKGITIMNFTMIIINAFVFSLLGLYAHNYPFILFSTLIVLPAINLLASGLSMLTCALNKTFSAIGTGTQLFLMIVEIVVVYFLHTVTGTYGGEVLDIKNAFILTIIICSIIFGSISVIVGTYLLKKRIMLIEVKL